MLIQEQMNLQEKLAVLSDAAKYDVSCTSSGVDRKGKKGTLGNAVSAGLCHSFAADGRCISLLKILLTNQCIYDCRYCINRRSNDVVRTAFTPDEVCTLTMEFYRRNYIEGLFLSSGILHSPDYTMDLIYQTLRKLRGQCRFNGYIHVKAIPGADPVLIEHVGLLADRMSVNLELPTAQGLKSLAPSKHRSRILAPMRQIQRGIKTQRTEIIPYERGRRFVPAGQSTQMIVGATPENDYQMIKVAEALYQNYDLKRVFYSAFVRVNDDSALPALPGGPPLLREHRLYQADWLMRFYGFGADELLSEGKPHFNVLLDPKCDWALRHMELFPVEINRAAYSAILRVPGIGVKSAKRIMEARRTAALDFGDLKKLGVVLKRAVYFITCRGRTMYPVKMDEGFISRQLVGEEKRKVWDIGDTGSYRQISMFDDGWLAPQPTAEDVQTAVLGQI
ncbi:MAG: putative DNA modification/repair radical SAM protein [Hungatella sp.]|nr:putative DNA modification/repair radical SAM protein [Hungatella sp.]